MEGQRRPGQDPPLASRQHRRPAQDIPGRVVRFRRPTIPAGERGYTTVRQMLRRLTRSWHARVAVEGDSMRPTLESGDWLLADPDAYSLTPPGVGDLVLVPDPRESRRLLVKRVSAADGRSVLVEGDAPAASTDSRAFGPVDLASVEGRPWFRYWPPRRIGRVR